MLAMASGHVFGSDVTGGGGGDFSVDHFEGFELGSGLVVCGGFTVEETSSRAA